MPVTKMCSVRTLPLVAAALFALAAPARTAPPAAPTDPPPSGLKQLWVLDPARLSPADQLLTQTLQGLANRGRPRVWLHGRSMYAVVEDQLRREGVELHPAESPWALLPELRSSVRGMVIYRAHTPSVNAATSLCGVLDGVAVEEAAVEHGKSLGLPVLVDAREMDERQAFERYRERFARGLLVEQSTTKPGTLRDFAVARRAFTFFSPDSAFRTRVTRELGPDATVWGWGDEELKSISDYSRANASCAPADWCLNLSALPALPAGTLRRPRRPVPAVEPRSRYVAFVLSDGDNVQWLCGGLVGNRRFWDSPLRGQFPMTWEVSPLLAKAAPRVLQHLYATAKESDGFVSGAGLPGYTYPHLQPHPQRLARQAAPLLAHSDLSVASVLNTNQGDLPETAPLLELPGVDGVIYKDYAPYHRHHGKIWWRRGKPCISYRFLLWDRIMSPDELAQQVARMPLAADRDEESYALVQVHAWSYGSTGGPLEAVRKAISLLPAGTRVVTGDQLVEMVRRQFGARHRD